MKTPLFREVDLGPGHIVLDGSRLPAKWALQPPPSFRPMSTVATVAHLSYCCALVMRCPSPPSRLQKWGLCVFYFFHYFSLRHFYSYCYVVELSKK